MALPRLVEGPCFYTKLPPLHLRRTARREGAIIKFPLLPAVAKPSQPEPIPTIRMLTSNAPVIAMSYSGRGDRTKLVPSPEFETTKADRERVTGEFYAMYNLWRAEHPQAAAEIDRYVLLGK